MPLFVASALRWARTITCDCDYCLDLLLTSLCDCDDSCDFALHDRMMWWPRGWVARHGHRHRKMLSSPREKNELGDSGQTPAKRVSRKGSHAYTPSRRKEGSRTRQRHLHHPQPQSSSRSAREMHIGNALGSKRTRVSLKREL